MHITCKYVQIYIYDKILKVIFSFSERISSYLEFFGNSYASGNHCASKIKTSVSNSENLIKTNMNLL